MPANALPRSVLVLLVIAVALLAPAAAEGAEYVVDSVADEPDAALGDGICATRELACTLRAAMMEAATHPGEHATVVVPAGRYELTIPPALAPTDAAGPLNGDLNILWPMTIKGAGARRTIVDGNGLDRVFTNTIPGVGATISGLTVTGGVAAQRELLVVTGGGGIANQGILTLRRVVVTGNRADYGGGLFNTPSGRATLIRSAILDNVANLEAGGVRFDSGGLVVNSTIAGNRVLSSCCDDLSSWDGSNVGEGGGIDARGGGRLTIVNSTIVDNHAVTGGGGVNIATGYQGGLGPIQGVGGPIELRNTIVARNTTDSGPENCKHTVSRIVSLGHNLDDGDSCGLSAAGDLPRTKPGLSRLGYHGGPSLTYLPRPRSPVIDVATGCPRVDQRGVRRPQGRRCDIGAVERAPDRRRNLRGWGRRRGR